MRALQEQCQSNGVQKMANEKRLIEANALRTQFDDIPPFIGLTGGCVQQAIDIAPTVDAVEVVRCKNCKWHSERESGRFDEYECVCNHPQWQDAEGWFVFVDADGFCYCGERGVSG